MPSLIILALAFLLGVRDQPKDQDYLVLGDKSFSAGGSTFASMRSAWALKAPESPTFVFGTAFAFGNPFVNGENVPYMLIVQHAAEGDFKFASELEMNTSYLVTTSMKIDDCEVSVAHQLTIDQMDSSKLPRVNESFSINGKAYRLKEGRLFLIQIRGDGFTVTQAQVASLPIEIFCTKAESDRKRIDPVLSWWEANKAKFHEH